MYLRRFYFAVQQAANSNKEWWDGFSDVVTIFYAHHYFKQLKLGHKYTKQHLKFVNVYIFPKLSFKRETIVKINHATALKLLLYKPIFSACTHFLYF